jgi:UDP-glucose 6-dehydrogenase
MDSRIGCKSSKASVGLSSCFPKRHFELGIYSQIIWTAMKWLIIGSSIMNDHQKRRFSKKYYKPYTIAADKKRLLS